MKMIKDHILSLLNNNLREDGRGLLDYRKPIKVEYGISPKSAEGSSRVSIGDTIVVAGVKFDVGEPFPDTPDEGVLMVGTELLPLSNPEFESGPPGIEAIEIARVVDRGMRESKSIDFKKLCIKKNEKVWMINLDIYPINDDGNLFDAAYLAALAALKDAKFPEYNGKEGKINYEKKTNNKLKLNNLPIGITVLKIGDKFIVDPMIEEWKNLDARLTITTLEDGNICAMQKGGDSSLNANDIEKMVDIASQKTKFLRNFL